MRIHHIALAIAATFLLAGCLPVTSKTPVGTTAGLGADEALTGTWVGRSQDEKDKGAAYFHFLKGKNGALMALMVFAGGGNDEEWTAFNLRTATLGKNHFVNAIETFNNNEPVEGNLKDVNIPLLYSFGRHHRLTLYLLDEDKVKEAIKAGKIAGTIESGDYGDVTITADAAALDAFMAMPEAAKLFKVFVVLKKAE